MLLDSMIVRLAVSHLLLGARCMLPAQLATTEAGIKRSRIMFATLSRMQLGRKPAKLHRQIVQ